MTTSEPKKDARWRIRLWRRANQAGADAPERLLPYSQFRVEELILRDLLARDRTVLANERTLLSYSRTGLMFIVSGATLFKLVSPGELWSLVVGVLLAAIGIAIMIFGVRRYRSVDEHMRRLH